MKSFTISWNSLYNGEFPVQELNKRIASLNIQVNNTPIGPFDQDVTFTLADRASEFDADTIFKLGMLVASYKY